MANRMFLGVLTFKHSHSRRIRFFNSQSGNMILEFIPEKCPSENAGVIVIDINVGKCYSFSSDKGTDVMESGMDVFRRILFLAKFIAAWWSTASGMGNKPSSDMPSAPRHLLSVSRHVLRFCRRLRMNGSLLALPSNTPPLYFTNQPVVDGWSRISAFQSASSHPCRPSSDPSKRIPCSRVPAGKRRMPLQISKCFSVHLLLCEDMRLLRESGT